MCFECQVAEKCGLGMPISLKKKQGVGVGSTHPGARLQVVESWFYHILAAVSHSISLQIFILIWKMGLTIVMRIIDFHICKVLKRILGT